MWFTSDLHLGHEGIIRMANRPFTSVEQMNRSLIANINNRVSSRDMLYILGDFSHKVTVEQALAFRKKIVCPRVYLVKGNHDKAWGDPDHPECFTEVCDYLEVAPGYAKGRKLVLSHYPMLSWNGRRRDSIMLHGHIHSEGPSYNERNRERGVLRYDVGVDANEYVPVSLDDILAFFDGVQSNRQMGDEN